MDKLIIFILFRIPVWTFLMIVGLGILGLFYQEAFRRVWLLIVIYAAAILLDTGLFWLRQKR